MGLWEITLSTPSSPGFSQLAVEKGEELGFCSVIWRVRWFHLGCHGSHFLTCVVHLFCHILQLFLHCLDRLAELQDKRAKLAVLLLNRHGLRDGSFQERFNGRKGREIQERYRSFFAGLPGPSRASLRRACFMRGCWWSRPTLGALQLSNYGVQKHAPL